MKALIDTNIFIYFFSQTPQHLAKRCANFLIQVQKGQQKYLVSLLTIAEIVWVMESLLHKDKQEIKKCIESILETKNIEVKENKLIKQSLLLYSYKNIDFIDAYNAVYMTKFKINNIYSFDQHFKKIEHISLIKP